MSILPTRFLNEGKYIKICLKIRENLKDTIGGEIDTLVIEIYTLVSDLKLFNLTNWS